MPIFPFINVHEEQTVLRVVCIILEGIIANIGGVCTSCFIQAMRLCFDAQLGGWHTQLDRNNVYKSHFDVWLFKLIKPPSVFA
jgi:hypothetical protein